MIQCENCGVTYIPGTLFCAECGAILYKSEENGITKPWSFANFMILQSGRKQKIPLTDSEPILIGRADPDEGYWPHLDLSDDGGAAYGVSRHHAAIQLTKNELVLIDKGSVNSTWIDNVKLEPHRPFPLPASGRLRFGRMDVHIFFE